MEDTAQAGGRARRACAPDPSARSIALERDFTHLMRFTPPSPRARQAATVLGAGFALLLAAAPTAAFAEPWVASSASDSIQLINQLFWLTLVLAGVVFVLVEGLLIYSALRFRRRAPLPTREPPQIHGNTRLETMWAVVPALILVGLFGLSIRTMDALASTPPDAARVRVEASQFSWSFTYANEGVESTDKLVLPVNRPVAFDVTARDVIHSFWVPELGGKIDAMPGKITVMHFTPRKTGKFRGVCAELCGAGHATMLFEVEVRSEGEFAAWIAEQKGGPAAPAAGGAVASPADADAGRQLVASKACGGCHVIPGVAGAAGMVGPSLAGVGQRTQIAGGAVRIGGVEDMKKWVQNPAQVKPGTAMPNMGLTDDEAGKVAAFLSTLR